MRNRFIICSRLDSSRVTKKAVRIINGKPLLEHLIKRLLASDIPVIVAVPYLETDTYKSILEPFGDRVQIFSGSPSDPLDRMDAAATYFEVNNVIRVCHDKVFVDPHLVLGALDIFLKRGLDYLYGSEFTEGSGFEIISKNALSLAAKKFKNCEHISYAIKCVTDNVLNFSVPDHLKSKHRLLIDYPKDLSVIETILSYCGNSVTLREAIDFLDSHPWLARFNELPKLTVYTCAYNSQRWIDKCMGSISQQAGFKDFQYIIVNDASTDNTLMHITHFASNYSNVEIISNPRNVGLSSSSNIALSNATGKYILRLDADDYFPARTSLVDMIKEIEEQNKDVIYPNNFFGDLQNIQQGKENHHVGGAIFKTRALNHVKFMDRLRGYEGLDLYLRAKETLDIGYLARPIFFYRQHETSLSKNDLLKRKQIKEEILNGHRAN